MPVCCTDRVYTHLSSGHSASQTTSRCGQAQVRWIDNNMHSLLCTSCSHISMFSLDTLRVHLVFREHAWPPCPRMCSSRCLDPEPCRGLEMYGWWPSWTCHWWHPLGRACTSRTPVVLIYFFFSAFQLPLPGFYCVIRAISIVVATSDLTQC